MSSLFRCFKRGVRFLISLSWIIELRECWLHECRGISVSSNVNFCNKEFSKWTKIISQHKQFWNRRCLRTRIFLSFLHVCLRINLSSKEKKLVVVKLLFGTNSIKKIVRLNLSLIMYSLDWYTHLKIYHVKRYNREKLRYTYIISIQIEKIFLVI